MEKTLFVLVAIILQSTFTFCQTNSNEFPVLKGPYFGQKPPILIPELFAPEILLQPKQAHSNIVFNHDGNQAYWCNDGLWFSEEMNGKWTAPVMVPFSKKDYTDDAPFLSPDGKKLFFTSKRLINSSDTTKQENIWFVELIKNGWSEAKPLPPTVNDIFQHWQVSVDLKGNLYFRYLPNNDLTKDSEIYCSNFVDGEYHNPEKLGATVNSNLNESNPFISPNGDYIIFSRIKDRKPFNGGLFISFKIKNGSWTEATPLSRVIKFNFGGNCPIITMDGKYLFFLDIYEGKWERFWIDAKFIEELKPKE